MLTIEKILASALRDSSAAELLGPMLASDLAVPNPFYRQIAEFTYKFLDQHHALPREGDFQVWLATLTEQQRSGISGALHELYKQDLSGFTIDYIVEQAGEALRTIAARTAVARIQTLPEITPDTLREFSEKVEALKPTTLEGLADVRDVDRWLRPETHEDVIPSGIQTIDQYIDGFRQELVFIMADSGVGKTISLVNFGQYFALQGKNVLHVSLELLVKPTIQRYYRRMAESDRTLMRNNPDEVRRRLGHVFRFAKGQVRVLYQEAHAITVEDLRALCRQYIKRYGKLDALILDYLDLLAPSDDIKRLSTAEQQGIMTHRVRAFCPEFECAVISATQATREGGGASRLNLQHMSSSYGKVRGADIIFGLVQTDEEEEHHQGRMGLLKVRENPGRGAEVPLYINRDLMLIADLQHPNTLRIMRELGHMPAGGQ